MEEKEINENLSVITSLGNFEYVMKEKTEVGGESNYHYRKIIKRFSSDLKYELEESDYLEEEVKDLKIFVRQLSNMMETTTVLFNYSYRQRRENKPLENNFNIAKLKLKEILDSLMEFGSIIKYYERQGEYLLALKMKHFCYDSYKRSLKVLEKKISIKIGKSTLAEDFATVQKQLKKSTSAKKIGLLKELESTGDSNVTPEKLELKKSEEYKTFTWFKVGLTFATGEAQKGYNNHQNYTRLASELGFKDTDRPYFSESFSAYSTDSKNIFAQPVKLDLLLKHCKENNIPLDPDFVKRLPNEMK
ncbi:hypothetical protein FHG64_15995 [Antarcticibacterium flavum]|uniref:Uncharacterized protein n=1 Tax=Antarcticibacterium flavum TaxID=2058175 RepID=A0A5B7X6J8_9FLAO|nr:MULTISPECIES: hypothetical protein [Antarcticibacterium]MCM4161865.1 hypothetical protein [Antarcticibacterium sp. W02-3]QCY70770.1 hypothetical protein FHG64_15995 [Antarcticibacterium flavum]